MLTRFRRNRGLVRALGTPVRRAAVANTARTLARVARKLAPYARAAGAKSTLQRKLGPVKVVQIDRKGQRAMRSAGISAQYDAPGNDYSKVKHTLGRRKKSTIRRLNRLLHKTMNNQVYRFQNISQFDTTVGALPMCQYYNSSNTYTYVPLHIYDLTSFPNTSATGPSAGRYFGWAGAAATVSATRGIIPGQDNDGTTDANGYWWQTERSGSSGIPNASIMMHNWTDVRLLLYGSRKRSTTFKVTFFRCIDESANPFHAATSNTDLKQLVEWFTRPMIYNTLQTYETKVSKKIKIIKQYTYIIPGCQTTDVDTTVGKTKEVRIFMRHDKVYNLDWLDAAEANLPHALPDGLDYVVGTTNQDNPWHGSRVFMAITALCPEKLTKTVDFPQGANINAESEPSYDIIIRNSLTTP